jgi:hypothetical protein
MSDPTDGELNAQQAARRLADGARGVSRDLEASLAGVEQVLDCLPSLCARILARRQTLRDLARQGTRLTCAPPVASREPLVRKINAAQRALAELLGA